MPYNNSTHIPGENYQNVKLNCANLRIAFLAFDLLFITFILLFLGLMALYSGNPRLAEPAKQLSDFFSQPKAFMIGPVIILGTLMYFLFARKTITWYNGLQIDDTPVEIENYQFKQFMGKLSIMYLKAGRKLWIVYPVTSQDYKKFPDAKIYEKEAVENQVQVEILKDNLAASGAVEKRFWFFTKDVVVTFTVFVTIIIFILSGLLIKY